jgi:transposase InsO family protein
MHAPTLPYDLRSLLTPLRKGETMNLARTIVRVYARNRQSNINVLRRPLELGQYLSIRYTERLAEAGIEPSVGRRGDSYDNALAESVIGLYKTEVIHRNGPWRGYEDVEFATLEWVWWFNNHRLLEPLGHVPPAEYEEQSHRGLLGHTDQPALTQIGLR